MQTANDTMSGVITPADRAVRYRQVIRDRGTLTATESADYRDAVQQMRRGEGRERTWIATLLAISPSAVSRLLRDKPAGGNEGAAA